MFETIPNEVLEFVLFPMLDLLSLFSARRCSRKMERLCRTSLSNKLTNYRVLISLGNVFSDPRNPRKDIVSSLRMFGRAGTLVEQRKQEEQMVQQEGAIVRTQTFVYHLKSRVHGCFGSSVGKAVAYRNFGWYKFYAFYRVGVCLYELKQYQDAIDMIEPMLSDQLGSELHAHLNLLVGLCYLELGDLINDKKMIKKSIMYYECVRNALALYNLACCHCLLENYVKARQCLAEGCTKKTGLPPLSHALNDPQLQPLQQYIRTLKWPTKEEMEEEKKEYDLATPILEPSGLQDELYFEALSKQYPAAIGM